jgi:(2Fe-2S) ferredoxin
MSKHKQVSEFDIQGQFLGFAAQHDYKLKYIRLATQTGEYCIKIPKEERSALYRTLVPGISVRVVGYREFCLKKGTTKFKAYQIVPANIPANAELGVSQPTVHPTVVPFTPAQFTPPIAPGSASKPTTKPAAILVCQKSDCCKRGGKALMDALKSEIGDRGLTDQVAIKPTGCMKRCKAGPNLVMPDKTQYTHIKAEAVPALLDKHFPTPAVTKAG